VSYEQSSTRGRSAGPVRVRRAAAFTLPELLVVIGIIALLVTIMVPTMSQALNVAYDRVCKGHLARIGQAMQRGGVDPTGKGNSFALPEPAGWMGLAFDLGKDLLLCPKDASPGGAAGMDSLKNYYILQSTHDGKYLISDLGAALGIDGGVLQDGQFHVDGGPNPPPAHATAHTGGHGPCYCGIPDRLPNQRLIVICSEGRVLVTMGPGSMVKFESIIGCMAGASTTASDHWLMKGSCTNGAESLTKDKIIMRLGGKNCTTVAPAYAFNLDRCSYAMNDQVPLRMASPQQIMIMDANMVTEIPLGEAGWMGKVSDRHFNRANYVTTGGSVHSANKVELMREYVSWDEKGDVSGSLWGRQAVPPAVKD
jgi:prepilin-type N-terminal cleavage/methylation domain-containing protein